MYNADNYKTTRDHSMTTKTKLIIVLLALPLMINAQNLILDGNSIQMDTNSTVSIDSTTGDITITSQTGDLTCSSNSIAPILSSLTSNPTSVLSGGTSTISWTLSGSASTCTKSGDWSGTITGGDVTDGTHTFDVTNITANSTYGLQCSNNIGSSSLLTTTVTLSSSANCVTQPPLSTLSEDFTIISQTFGGPTVYDGTYKDFQQIQNPIDWPGNFGDSINLSLSQNEYLSASFITNSNSDQGTFQLATPGNAQGPGSQGTIVISECPGDFTTHINQATCLRQVGTSGSFRWATDPAAGSNYCKLEKNTLYYLNIVHSLTPENGYVTSSCSSSTYCGILAVQVKNN